MSIPGLAFGFDVLVVGVEDDPNGMLRVYIGHRADGRYLLVADPATQERVRRAWGWGHLTIPKPPADAVFSEANPPGPDDIEVFAPPVSDGENGEYGGDAT